MRKYHLGCTSIKYSHGYDINIEQEDYAGKVIEKSLGASPILRKDESKSGAIQGTSVELTIQADKDFELIEFYSSNNKKHKVEILKNGELLWKGYVLPEQYQESYIAPPYDVVLTASDGLGVLRNIPFYYSRIISTAAGELDRFEDRDVEILRVIDKCLESLDLGLGYRIAISLREDRMSKDECVLSQIYESPARFAGLSCYDVLEQILTSFSATITQLDGRWFIFREYDLLNESLDYSNTLERESPCRVSVMELGSANAKNSDVYVLGSLSMQIANAKSDVVVEAAYPMSKNLWSGKAYGPPSSEGGFYMQINNPSDYHVEMLNFAASSWKNYHVRLSVDKLSRCDTVFQINYKHRTWKGFGEGEYKHEYMLVMYSWNIYDVSGAGTMYYLNDKGWGTEEHRFIATGSTFEPDKEVSIKFRGLPRDGSLHLIICGNTNRSFGKPSTAGWNSAPLTISKWYMGAVPDNSGISIKGQFDKNASESGGVIKSIFIDAPLGENATRVYSSCMRMKGGILTNNWGGAEVVSFGESLLYVLASKMSRASTKLVGSLQGKDMDLSSIVHHEYTNGYYYMSNGSIDLVNDEFSGCMSELQVSYSGGFGKSSEPIRVSSGRGDEHRSVDGVDYRVYSADGKGFPKRIGDLAPINSIDLSRAIIEVDSKDWDSSKKIELDQFALLDRPNTFKNDIAVEGDFIVKGDIIQEGAVYEVHAEHVISKKDLMDLREGAEKPILPGAVSGFRVLKADGKRNVLFGASGDGVLRIGVEGTPLQPLLTREDSPESGGVLHYDAAKKRAVSRQRAKDSDLLEGMSASEYVQCEREQVITGEKDFKNTQRFENIVLGDRYIPGWEGSGGGLRKDVDGKVYLEVDDISIRRSARFYELVVKRYRTVGGTLFVSNGEKTTRVEDEPVMFDNVGNYNPKGRFHMLLRFNLNVR